MDKGKTHSVPVSEEAWRELNRIKAKKGVAVVRLIEYAVPLLKRKYRIKDDDEELRK